MKIITTLAIVDPDKCSGCKTCYAICPVLAIRMENRKAVIDEGHCFGCNNCEQRCPEYAITMVSRSEPRVVEIQVNRFHPDAILDLCISAKFHPEQVVCFCTGTRAGEIAAAIMDGAKTPEEVSLKTGARTGCKVLCIAPILRLLYAAGITPQKPDGIQWCGNTPTLWDISAETMAKYASHGFCFDLDKNFLEANLAYELGKGENCKCQKRP